MALPDVAYADYEAAGGALDEGAFAASLAHALAAVRYIIGFNAPETDDEVAAYRAAVCAAVDVDAAYGASGGYGETGGSLTVGSFSVGSGASGSSGTAYDADMERAVRGALAGTGLLFQGVG